LSELSLLAPALMFMLPSSGDVVILDLGTWFFYFVFQLRYEHFNALKDSCSFVTQVSP
jgi:hypothetical protein